MSIHALPPRKIAPSPVSAQTQGIVAVTDSFPGIDVLKVMGTDGKMVAKVMLVSGHADAELLAFLADWRTRH